MSKNEIAKINETSGFMQLAENTNIDMGYETAGLNVEPERIKLPSGGGTVFEVPGENPDEPDSVKEFSAVIVHHHPIHAYYMSKYTGGNNPPDCGSMDGINGEGNPGGSCAKCKFNKFGSGENGSKACKNRRRIYLLREGEIFPMVLSLPTGSLKEFSRYIKRLLARGKKSNSVVTRFTLKKATNNNGIAYSQAQFSIDRPLNDEEYTLINSLSEQVKEYSKNIGFDVGITDEEAETSSAYVDHETGETIEPLK